MGNFYGYNPAEYRADVNFIGDAMDNLGAGLAYIPEIKQARQAIDDQTEMQVNIASELTSLADTQSRDMEFVAAARDQHYDGVSSREMVQKLYNDGRFAEQDRLRTNGDTYQYNSGSTEAPIWEDLDETKWDTLAGAQVRQDILNMIPGGTIHGRRGTSYQVDPNKSREENLAGIDELKGRRVQGVEMTNEEAYNRVSQSMENYMLPIFKNSRNNIDQGTMYAALAVGDYGNDETNESIRTSINDSVQKRHYLDAKQYVESYQAETPVESTFTTSLAGKTDDIELSYGEIGMSGLEAQQYLLENKVNHSAASTMVENTQRDYDSDVTAYIHNFVDHQYARRLAKYAVYNKIDLGDLDEDFHNTPAMKALQEEAWDGFDMTSAVEQLGLTQNMSDDARTQLMNSITRREENKRVVSTSMFQRRIERTPVGGGGSGLSASDNPHKWDVEASKMVYNNLVTEQNGYKAALRDASGDEKTELQRKIEALKEPIRIANDNYTAQTAAAGRWQANLNVQQSGGGNFISDVEQQSEARRLNAVDNAEINPDKINEVMLHYGVTGYDEIVDMPSEERSGLLDEMAMAFGSNTRITEITEDMATDETPVGSLGVVRTRTTRNGTVVEDVTPFARELMKGEVVDVSIQPTSPSLEVLDDQSTNRIMMDNMTGLIEGARQRGGRLTDTQVKNFVESFAPEGTTIDKTSEEWRELTTLIADLSSIEDPENYTVINNAVVPTEVVQSVSALSDETGTGNVFDAKGVIELAQERGVDLMGVPDNVIETIISDRQSAGERTTLGRHIDDSKQYFRSIGEFISEKVMGPRRDTDERQSGGVRIYGRTQ